MRTLGVEEEFQLVDLETRRLTGQAPELLAHLSDSYVAELQRCVVEINSAPVDTLGDLRSDLVRSRSTLVGAAAEAGVGVVAAGTVPLAVPAELQVTATDRYRDILADYQLLAREQLVCGTQVHVGIDDRDEAVAVAQRVAPYLPALLALSASSPFQADGIDTGYASSRTLMIQRWPTTGLAAPVNTAAAYDQLVTDLVSTGVISDAGMVYFDVRPANSAPTLELRICDSCPSVDTIVLIAGLFRALVDHESQGLHADEPALIVLPPLGRAAIWRAARSGLEGELVDLTGPIARPAASVITDLLNRLRPQLEDTGDWDDIADLTRCALASGTSAARQRTSLQRRGRLSDVVDRLIADTAADGPRSGGSVSSG
jgi:carboxylate-amine ligase